MGRKQGKSWEDIFGKEKANEMKAQLREYNIKNKVLPVPTKLGSKFSEKRKQKMSQAWTKEKRKEASQRAKARTGKESSNKKHHQKILKEMDSLKSQGFRTIPITNIIPDIIAIKDNKVYAIEVEYGHFPNYGKYEDCDIFDDIIWIVKSERALRRKKGV